MQFQPMTIFEGPDCGGKSTLVELLREKTSRTVVHHGPYPDETDLCTIYERSMAPALGEDQGQIWDRCWISEVIYGIIHRSANRLDKSDIRYLEALSRPLKPVVVLCLPPYKVVLNKWLERKGEEYLQKEESLRKVYEFYKLVPLLSSLPVITHDYTIHNEGDLWAGVANLRKQ